jgi:NAD(P)-dependent dehydrogenase (short-subunit alcohol dehydrogenase family)
LKKTPIFAPGLFTGRHVLVTGGGTGIGFAIAEEFGALGARVTIAARTEERLKAAADKLRAGGIDAAWFPVNIRKEDEVARLFETVERERGLPDFLVNNAGGQFTADALDITPNGFRAVMDLNVQGTWHMCRSYAGRAIALGRPGCIVNMVFADIQGMPRFAHGAAARAAIVNLTKTLAMEWGHRGIRVNAIGLGSIATEALKQYSKSDSGRDDSGLPIPRLGEPREVALAAAYLCSPAADYITGTVLTIDGGQSLIQRAIPD